MDNQSSISDNNNNSDDNMKDQNFEIHDDKSSLTYSEDETDN